MTCVRADIHEPQAIALRTVLCSGQGTRMSFPRALWRSVVGLIFLQRSVLLPATLFASIQAWSTKTFPYRRIGRKRPSGPSPG